MLERIGATWPVRPLLLCAGAANTNISSFWTHPCSFFLCAGAVHTQLMLERMITPSSECVLFLCAGAVNTHISSFWTPVGTPGCSKVAHMVHTGAGYPNCFPGRPESLIWFLPGPPGALSGHSEATLVPNWCPMASPTRPSEEP